ncbi:amino acid-binding protein [Flexivirga endophytica]|uniref:Amino acid-binding protein n=1 Tax=Flexivirga endophytica TaxID=1849103 RepID=A0A916T324_9MICO|nr:amino acid-binding protein [Flexivirga endophytica]GGB26855.1 amino acid-binding protein [Flexivirga endophytica]GHB55314.1 amino acid-binding protein [Flexivirga endophytica]
MFDVEIPAPDGATSLLRIGNTLGAAGVGLEGGGMWSGAAHYLVSDGEVAVKALRDNGFHEVAVTPVAVVELGADVPGALAGMMGELVDAGVVLHGQYSDHDNRKVLLVDDVDAAYDVLGKPV